MKSLNLKAYRFGILEKFIAFILIYVICSVPIQRFAQAVDGAGRFPTILLIFCCILILGKIKNDIFSKPLSIYLILAIYMLFNVLAKGTYMPTFIYFKMIFDSVFFMWLVAYLSQVNFDKTIWILFIGFYLYTLLCFFNGSMSAGERLGGAINANTIGLNAFFTIAFALILYVRKEIKLFLLVVLLILPFFVAIQTGSRMTLGASLFIIAGTFIVSRDKKNILSLIGGIFILGVIAVITYYILEHTLVGERLTGTSTQVEGGQLETGTILDLFGDRGFQYYVSWPYFLDNLITGIGLRHWAEDGPTGYVCHSEYLTMYLENGLIGIALYVAFYYQIIKRLLQRKAATAGTDKNIFKYLLLVFIAMLFINSVLWSFDALGFFAIYALSYTTASKTTRTIATKKPLPNYDMAKTKYPL